MTISHERRIELNKFIREWMVELSNEERQHVASFIKDQERSLTTVRKEETWGLLNPHQVQVFEKVLMPFGAHKDIPIGEVPYEYLCNLFDPSPFMKKLKLYLEYCSKHRHRS